MRPVLRHRRRVPRGPEPVSSRLRTGRRGQGGEETRRRARRTRQVRRKGLRRRRPRVATYDVVVEDGVVYVDGSLRESLSSIRTTLSLEQHREPLELTGRRLARVDDFHLRFGRINGIDTGPGGI